MHGEWIGKALVLISIVRETTFVGEPLLVDVFINAWDHADDLITAGIHANVGAHAVRKINRFRVPQLIDVDVRDDAAKQDWKV